MVLRLPQSLAVLLQVFRKWELDDSLGLQRPRSFQPNLSLNQILWKQHSPQTGSSPNSAVDQQVNERAVQT